MKKLISPIAHLLEHYLGLSESSRSIKVVIEGHDSLTVHVSPNPQPLVLDISSNLSSTPSFSIKRCSRNSVMINCQNLGGLFRQKPLKLTMSKAVKWLDDFLIKEKHPSYRLDYLAMYNTLLKREDCENQKLILSDEQSESDRIGRRIQFQLSYLVNRKNCIFMNDCLMDYRLPEEEKMYLGKLIDIGRRVSQSVV